jgi:hypothetical protein
MNDTMCCVSADIYPIGAQGRERSLGFVELLRGIEGGADADILGCFCDSFHFCTDKHALPGTFLDCMLGIEE